MDRRGFISKLLLACAAPQVLVRMAPDGFKWTKGRELLVVNPEMPFSARDFSGKWVFVTDPLEPAYKDLQTTFGKMRTGTEMWIYPCPAEYQEVILHKRDS